LRQNKTIEQFSNQE